MHINMRKQWFIALAYNKSYVEIHFKAHYEISFAMIILRWALTDFLFAVIKLQFAVIDL